MRIVLGKERGKLTWHIFWGIIYKYRNVIWLKVCPYIDSLNGRRSLICSGTLQSKTLKNDEKLSLNGI